MQRLKRLIEAIDRFSDAVGRAVAWLALAMVLTAAVVMIARYGFGWGRVWLQESYVWMHALLFLLGAAYTLRHDAHVRVDVFYREASPRRRALVDVLGLLFLLLPLLALIAWTGVPYVANSWARFESSREAGGLPGLYLLKSALLVFVGLMVMQALADLARNTLILLGHQDMVRQPTPSAEP